LIRYKGAKNADAKLRRTRAQALAIAEALRLELAEGAADFEAIARDKSEDGSAERGGDLGLVGRGMFAPAYEAAAFALAPGAISAVVETDFGFHIIQRVDG
jgi:parvulin-like peptidyl-prolyl isomerase